MGDLTDERTFIYRLDAQNRISCVNREWLDFARENQAPELTEERVVGEAMENFIEGWETNHLWEIIYEKVRGSRKEIQIPFRCDSPERKRYFLMRVVPLEDEELEFRVRVLRMEAVPSRPLLDTSVERSPDAVVICSWCRKIRMEDGRWVEIEEAAARRELFGRSPPSLTHDICPGCLAIVQRREDEGE